MKKKQQTSDVGPDLAELAKKLAADALKADIPAETRLDIFKALTTYHVNTTKVQAKLPEPDDEEGGFSIASARKRIETSASGDGQGNSGDDIFG